MYATYGRNAHGGEAKGDGRCAAHGNAHGKCTWGGGGVGRYAQEGEKWGDTHWKERSGEIHREKIARGTQCERERYNEMHKARIVDANVNRLKITASSLQFHHNNELYYMHINCDVI